MLFQLIIIQIITFLAIVFALKKFLYAETAKEAKRLKQLKEENTRKQRELQEKINAAEAVYNDKVAKAEEEVRRLRARAEEEAEKVTRKRIDEAREEAERIVKVAFNKKEKIREEAILEIQKKAPAEASQIFREALSAEVKKIIHGELVEEAVNHIKKMEKAKFNIKVKSGELASAYSLQGRQKNELCSCISEKLGKKIDFDEKEEKKLIAGLVIRLGNLVIDASLENRLKQIELGG